MTIFIVPARGYVDARVVDVAALTMSCRGVAAFDRRGAGTGEGGMLLDRARVRSDGARRLHH